MSRPERRDPIHALLLEELNAPYFWAHKLPNQIERKGAPYCLLGHRLSNDEGIFAEWAWDGQTLRIRNDRYGFYPLYYYSLPREIGVSPSITRLLSLGAPSDLDHRALAVFLRIGFMLGEATPFRMIRALPPRADMSWDGDLRSQAGGIWMEKRQDLRREEAIDRYISLFRAAMAKRSPAHDTCVLPLTGGKDSRHIVLELCERGHKIESCVTVQHFPPRPNDDALIAGELTTRLNLRHVVIPQPCSRLESERRKNLRTNFCSDEHQWAIALADYMIGRTTCAYDGLAGDILTSSNLQTLEHLRLFAEGDWENLTSKLLRKTDPAARILVNSRYQEMNRELAVEEISSELKKHANAPNPISSYFFWNRTRREIALVPYSILREIPVVYSPFLDHDLYDFLASLPGEMAIGTDFHGAAIRLAYPKFADLPFERTKVSRGPHHSLFRRFALETLRFMLGKRSNHIKQHYVLPRLMRCLIDEKYSFSVNWIAPMTVYLLQLEGLTNSIEDFRKD